MFGIILLAVCLAIPTVYCNSAGAPTAICKNGLTPEHHVDGQTSKPPYSFSAASSVRAGNELSVTLGGDSFLGFAIQAHDSKNQPVGKFKVVESNKSQILSCNGQGDTLTHKKIPSDNPATRVEFKYIPPAALKGQKVNLVATVAKNGGTYWIRKVIKTINVE